MLRIGILALQGDFEKHRQMLDSLGLIYIRHGEPDKKAFAIKNDVDLSEIPISIASRFIVIVMDEKFPGGISYGDDLTENIDQELDEKYGFYFIPMNVSWKYFSRPNRPEMIFHFAKYGGKGGWLIESVPTLPHNRESLDIRYIQFKKVFPAPSKSASPRKNPAVHSE